MRTRRQRHATRNGALRKLVREESARARDCRSDQRRNIRREHQTECAHQLSATRRLRVACFLSSCAHWGAGLAEAKEITATAEDNIYADEIILPATLVTSISSSRVSRTTSVFFSTAICNSAPATNTATMKLSYIPPFRRPGPAPSPDSWRRRWPRRSRNPEVSASRKHHPRRSRSRNDQDFFLEPHAHKLNDKSLLSLACTSSTPMRFHGWIRTR